MYVKGHLKLHYLLSVLTQKNTNNLIINKSLGNIKRVASRDVRTENNDLTL